MPTPSNNSGIWPADHRRAVLEQMRASLSKLEEKITRVMDSVSADGLEGELSRNGENQPSGDRK